MCQGGSVCCLQVLADLWHHTACQEHWGPTQQQLNWDVGRYVMIPEHVMLALLSHYAFPELNGSCSNGQYFSAHQDALVQTIFSWLQSHVFPAPLPHCTFPVLNMYLPNWQQLSVWMDALVQAIFS